MKTKNTILIAATCLVTWISCSSCNSSETTDLYDLEAASVDGKRIQLIVSRRQTKYEKTIGNVAMGEPGRKIEESNLYYVADFAFSSSSVSNVNHFATLVNDELSDINFSSSPSYVICKSPRHGVFAIELNSKKQVKIDSSEGVVLQRYGSYDKTLIGCVDKNLKSYAPPAFEEKDLGFAPKLRPQQGANKQSPLRRLPHKIGDMMLVWEKRKPIVERYLLSSGTYIDELKGPPDSLFVTAAKRNSDYYVFCNNEGKVSILDSKGTVIATQKFKDELSFLDIVLLSSSAPVLCVINGGVDRFGFIDVQQWNYETGDYKEYKVKLDKQRF